MVKGPAQARKLAHVREALHVLEGAAKLFEEERLGAGFATVQSHCARAILWICYEWQAGVSVALGAIVRYRAPDTPRAHRAPFPQQRGIDAAGQPVQLRALAL